MLRPSALLAAIGVAAFFQAAAQPAPSTILRPDRVFDGDTMHEGWAVRVRGDRIEAAGPAASSRLPVPRSSICRARR